MGHPSTITPPPRLLRALRLRALRLGALWLGALWLGAGCSEEETATPPEATAAAPEESSVSEPEPPPPAPGILHTVGDGESLWLIARTYEVSVNTLMEANDLRPRDVRRLRAGQTLRIPGATQAREVNSETVPAAPLPPVTDGAYHRMVEGETLWSVARQYEVPLSVLLERNELDDDAIRTLRPGRSIVIPGATDRDVARVAQRRADGEESPGARRGFRHTVARGETIWDLAGAFGVSVAELMAANSMSEEDVRALREGSRLWIPGVQRDAGGRVRRQLSGRQRTAAAFAARLGLGTRAAASQLMRGQVERRWIAAAARGRRDRLPGTLRWPITRGWFVRGYGSGEGGYHLATDIMGRIGWNVRAAAAGLVGYAGSAVRGYGNMVLLIHAGGWVTMYAHNSTNSVVAGERVPAGGIIGEVGSTGISRGPHVHFELFFDGRNCDPASLWRPGIRHRDGRLGRVQRAAWTRPDARPESVRCDPRRRHPRSRWVQSEGFGAEAGD